MALVKTVRTRLLGVGFLLLVAGLLALSVLVYNKTFTSVVPVRLQADRIGHQLVVPADVKLRGIIVGQVTGVHSNGDRAVLDLALEPSKVDLIPANVQARILPKTLFGEKFVDLVIPAAPSPSHLAAHDVIGLDRSSTAIEAEQVFNDLVPLLATLHPVELNMTLSNLADALRGRGNELGDNLARTDTYFAQANPDLPNFEADISGLADLATNLDAATPDLLATARQFSANARTLVAKADVYRSFLLGTQGFANTATAFLTANAANLVSLAKVSVPQLALLAQYSPEYPCLLEGLTKIEPVLGQTFKPVAGRTSVPALHIDLQVINQPNGYTYPADKPDYTLGSNPTFAGPHCYGLPNAPSHAVGAPPPLNNGGGAANANATTTSPQDMARILAAPQLGVAGDRVPDIATLLTAPQLAGMTVSLQ